MQEDNHIFQGLRRDNHQIRQDAKFLWDAHNIRLTNREDNTLLSLTNEKGTSGELMTFQGHYVGHCVLGKYLVVFTANDDGSDNYIYRIEKTDDGYKSIILFNEDNIWDGAWNPGYPIEAIGVYESELVQKVYWVDSKNQPRVINITKPELMLSDEEQRNILTDGVNLSYPSKSSNQDTADYITENYIDGLKIYNKECFDFARTLQLTEIVEVVKLQGQGMFSPGTIQYALSYYDKYGQGSNIFYTTPLHYISPSDRGGNPEERVANSFIINISQVDPNFDFIRIYSIHRTSINAVPTVKIVEDIPVNKNDLKGTLSYTDTGQSGSNIDPTQLLYIGGAPLIANCIAHKDNTLFLGGITQLHDSNLKDIEGIIKSDYEFDDWSTTNQSANISLANTYYEYTPSLDIYSAGFMTNETYRLGVQVQYNNGKWSSPIYVGDNTLTEEYPWETAPLRYSKSLNLLSQSDSLREKGVKRVRACIVFPTTAEREIICQGILCPTVYNVKGRSNNSPYAMSSWFFRPAAKKLENNISNGAYIQWEHNRALYTGADDGAEIQCMLPNKEYLSSIDDTDTYSSHFFVDENIVTFHSPDIEFDTSLWNTSWEGTSLRIIGMARLGAIAGDIDIQTSSPVIGDYKGFHHRTIGYQTNKRININGGLVSGLFYHAPTITKDFKDTEVGGYWKVYPWHRSGSLNNDTRRPTDTKSGTRSSVLEKKKISNLKFFDYNYPLTTTEGLEEGRPKFFNFNISVPKLFSATELSVIKISPSYLNNDITYLGNVDTLLSSTEKYKFYKAATVNGTPEELTGDTVITDTMDPVRMKYKSSPHLVFSLGNSANTIELLPRHAALDNPANNQDFSFPSWQDLSDNHKSGYDYAISYYGESELSLSSLITSPLDSELGTCSVRFVKGKVYVYIAEKTNKGNKWRVLSLTDSDRLILKLVRNETVLKGTLPLNTTKEDFIRDVYRGRTRYYEVCGTSITDVTDSFSTTSNKYKLSQGLFGSQLDENNEISYLLIGEIRRDNIINKFGGTTEDALRSNLWVPAGRPVNINPKETDSDIIVIPFEYGDTWYSRYDCLKTYPFTQEDENSVIEIGSFMCETRVNIDGRYDNNRGQMSNINMSPQNFNLLNEVYSQKDNFFNYRVLDKDYYKQNSFKNQLTWSMEKHSMEDIDTWTNITLANTLDMDGSRGNITALTTWNDIIMCFQEKVLSQILFNSRVQIPTADGAPIEISNGYKVDGSRAYSDSIGCSNKWSILSTPMGIYFMDSNTNSLYLFNGQLTNLSRDRGMDWWVRQNHTDNVWNPLYYNPGVLNGVRTFYDSKYGDVYFTPGPVYNIDQPDALCYSEQLGQFTSLMSYGGTQAMFNFADGFYSLRETDGNVKLYQNNVGDYNNFYGSVKGWDFSFISNQNPTLTKIFDTIELRADRYNGGTLVGDKYLTKSQPGQPFNFIRVNNEYQDTRWYDNNELHDVMFDYSNLRKKFRVWRGLIPRNHSTRQRIRNTWTEVTLGWTPRDNKGLPTEGQTDKVVVHDISVKYTV